MHMLMVTRQSPASLVMIHCQRCRRTWPVDAHASRERVGAVLLEAVDHAWVDTCAIDDPPWSERTI